MLTLAVGDVVVYAAHGIGRVEVTRPGGSGLPETVVILFANDLRVTLPVSRARRALRSLSGEVELEAVTSTLRANPEPAIEPWSKRFSMMREKVDAGAVAGLAEVVRDGRERERQLAANSGSRAAAAARERALCLKAVKLLSEEIALARGIDPADADAWIDAQTDNTQD